MRFSVMSWLLYAWQRRCTYCTGAWVGQSVWVWKILTSPGFEPWTIQCPVHILCQVYGCFPCQCHSIANSYSKNEWYRDYKTVYSCCTKKKWRMVWVASTAPVHFGKSMESIFFLLFVFCMRSTVGKRSREGSYICVQAVDYWCV